ncbi:MAG TPA: DUF6186 family protein [Acidimicrobiales bacterium]|nr:DUF6186 family protein [Acidimicrobiales bacterium]
MAVALLAAYAVLAAAMLATEAWARRHPPRPATLGQTVTRLVRRAPAVRWILLLGWAWMGWHLFVRTTPG